MYFNLGTEQQNVLFDFIKNHMTQNDNKNELEIRFGKFIWNGTLSNFKSEIEPQFFYRLKKMFSSRPCEEIITNEYINNQNIKKIVNIKPQNTNDQQKNTKYIKKNTINKYNVYDYDFRISHSEEYIYQESEKCDIENSFNNNQDNMIVRNKHRYRFDLDIAYLDFTIVKTDNNKETRELELEIKNNQNDETLLYNTIMNIICVILQTKYDNFYVIGNKYRNEILNKYKKMTNSNFFIGAQPETLHREQINILYKENYSVTDKADGERCFVFIDENGNIYSIDSNIQNVVVTDLNTLKFQNCLLDAEILRINQKIYLYIFDCLFVNGMDIRENKNFLLKNRIDTVKNIISTVQSYSNFNLYEIHCKKFIYKNVFLGGEILMNNNTFYKNDGLIFTPIDEPYPKTRKWQKLLKWKPNNLNTIDFYAINIGNNTWQLYVQAPFDNQNDKNKNPSDKKQNPSEKHKNSNVMLFDMSKFEEKTEKEQFCTYETSFGSDLIDPTTGESYLTNTVIEFYWDFNHKKFLPIRTRWDKTINPKKHGNFINVAKDIWKTINNPVTEDFLNKFTVNNKTTDIYFERMRRFHNKVKEYLYNTYCKDSNTLLELCSGRGGDLNKWKYNNIKHVHGYDISQKNIQECEKRVNTAGYNNQYKFFNLDLSEQFTLNTIQTNFKKYLNADKINTACCHFGIHYFFKNKENFDNITRILTSSLEDNGYFIVTFMDNKKLQELLNNESLIYKEQNGEIIYYLKNETSSTKTEFGNKLRIILNGNNILGEGSDEYIIDSDKFIENMKESGFDIIESNLFENIYEKFLTKYSNLEQLNEPEKDISFLNRYIVFQYHKSKNTQTLHNLSNLSEIKTFKNENENVFETKIDLHFDNLSVYKIVDTYDIIDILNCIEYKYCKTTNTNEQITNWDTILNTLKLYNITYDVNYVDNIYDFNFTKSNCMYFTYYKHIIEKQDETLEYDNWYIILQNDNIIHNWQYKITDNTQKPSNIESNINTQSQNETKQSSNVDIQTQKPSNINIDIINNPKVTLKELKDLLRELNLKVSGNKNELIERIKNHKNEK